MSSTLVEPRFYLSNGIFYARNNSKVADGERTSCDRKKLGEHLEKLKLSISATSATTTETKWEKLEMEKVDNCGYKFLREAEPEPSLSLLSSSLVAPWLTPDRINFMLKLYEIEKHATQVEYNCLQNFPFPDFEDALVCPSSFHMTLVDDEDDEEVKDGEDDGKNKESKGKDGEDAPHAMSWSGEYLPYFLLLGGITPSKEFYDQIMGCEIKP